MKSLHLLCIAILSAACSEPHAIGEEGSWTELPNRHAHCFQVFKNGEARRVVVFGPGGRTDTLGIFVKGDVGISRAGDVNVSHLERVAVLSTTHLPFLSALRRGERVVAAAHLGQIRDAALSGLIEQGRVREIGTASGVDREALLISGAQVVFDYPFGRGGEHSTGDGVPYVPVTEYLEEEPLGRAEWLRFFGVLLNAEAAADSVYAGIVTRYERAKALVDTSRRPTVLFGSTWQGQWFVPPGNSYMARLIADAGGSYLFADRRGAGNITLDMETMVALGAHADVWGMIAQVEGEPSLQDFTHGDERLASFNAVQQGQLFIANTATADLFGQALLEPDVPLPATRWSWLFGPSAQTDDEHGSTK